MKIKKIHIYITALALLMPSIALAGDDFSLPTSLLTDLYNKLTQFIFGYVGDMASKVSTILTPLMGACFGFYFVFKWGTMYFKSEYSDFMPMLMNGLKLAVVMSALYGSGWYFSTLIPFVMNVGDEIAAKLSSDGYATSLTGLEQVILNINAHGQRLYDLSNSLSFWDSDVGTIMITFLGLILFYLGGTVFVVYATAILIVSKFMVGLLLVIGPLYVMLMMYEQTSTFTKQWIGQAFNYILLNIFITLTLTVLIDFMSEQFPNQAEMGVGGAFYSLIAFMLGVFILGQIPTFVSTITGGTGISGITGATNAGAGMIAGAATGGAGLAYRAGKSVMNRFKGGATGG